MADQQKRFKQSYQEAECRNYFFIYINGLQEAMKKWKFYGKCVSDFIARKVLRIGAVNELDQ